MKGKKILIAHNWNNQGFSAQSVLLATHLSKENVVLFISQQRINATNLVINNNLTVLEWPNKRPNKLRDYYFAFKEIKAFRPDVTIAHFTAFNCVTITAWVLKVPVRIGWYHTIAGAIDTDWQKGMWKAWLQRKFKTNIYGLTTNMISVSKAAASDLHKTFGVPDTKITCIFNSISLKKENQLKTYNPLLIRFLGGYNANKGGHILLSAAAIILQKFPDVIFELAGNGDSKPFREMANKSGIESNIIFGGSIKACEVFDYVRGACLIIVPSLFEAFGMVVIESLSMGTPVIGSNTGGIAEIIKQGYNGFLFTPGNAGELADKIEGILVNLSLRESLSANAKLDFELRFSSKAYLNNVTSLLNSVV